MRAPDPMGARLKALARQLRIGYSTEACVELPEVMAALAEQAGTFSPARQQLFSEQTAQVLQAWERHDWLGLADTLEFELPETLAG